MAAPTTAFKTFARTTAVIALDTRAERLAAWAGWTTVDTSSNPLDFGTVDISGGAANSLVFYLGWKVTANGGNTTVDNFRIWNETSSPDYWGFTLAGTHLKKAAMKFEAGGANGQTYAVDAVTGTYTFTDIELAGAPAQNCYAGDGATSIDVTTVGTTDDVVGNALYLAVADNEITGTYQGTTAGKEFRGSFRFDYS